MKIKTSEAKGLQLDWGLAKALEYAPEVKYEAVFVPAEKRGWPIEGVMPFDHTDPRVCMGLIKEYCIQLYPFCDGEIVRWDTDIRPDVRIVNCDTPEQAVARCVISMRVGDEFEVPDELARGDL